MPKLKLLFIVLMLVGLPVRDSAAEDQVQLEVGDKVDVHFDKETSHRIFSSIGERAEAYGGSIGVTGKIDRYEDGAFIAIGEFGINAKDKKSLVRITVPVQLSECKPVRERHSRQYSMRIGTLVLDNPSVTIKSVKGVKIERWNLESEIALAEEAK